MPCLAYLGPLASRRSPVVGAGRRSTVARLNVARLLGARSSLLAARHSWPFSLARCSDAVGRFNGPRHVGLLVMIECSIDTKKFCQSHSAWAVFAERLYYGSFAIPAEATRGSLARIARSKLCSPIWAFVFLYRPGRPPQRPPTHVLG